MTNVTNFPSPDERAVEVCNHIRRNVLTSIGEWRHGAVPEPCWLCLPFAKAIGEAVEVALAVRDSQGKDKA